MNDDIVRNPNYLRTLFEPPWADVVENRRTAMNVHNICYTWFQKRSLRHYPFNFHGILYRLISDKLVLIKIGI